MRAVRAGVPDGLHAGRNQRTDRAAGHHVFEVADHHVFERGRRRRAGR
jgi:hypothetical protein